MKDLQKIYGPDFNRYKIFTDFLPLQNKMKKDEKLSETVLLKLEAIKKNYTAQRARNQALLQNQQSSQAAPDTEENFDNWTPFSLAASFSAPPVAADDGKKKKGKKKKAEIAGHYAVTDTFYTGIYDLDITLPITPLGLTPIFNSICCPAVDNLRLQTVGLLPISLYLMNPPWGRGIAKWDSRTFTEDEVAGLVKNCFGTDQYT